MSIDKCKKDLPNFPEEIITDWLATYVQSEGWPPCESNNIVPNNRWKYLLGNRPVNYWQNIQWTKQKLQIDEIKFTPESESTIAYLIEAYIEGKENFYSLELGENGKQRFRSLLMYMAQNRCFPVPPVLVSNRGIMEVVDGNHRITVGVSWLHLQYRKEFRDMFDFNPESFNGSIEAWVGEYPCA